MTNFNKADDKVRIQESINLLKNIYPNAKTALHFQNPLELLIATMLSAQCTDEIVNKVTKTLFKKYKTAKDYATANIKELEEIIHPTGFYHNKAKNIIKTCKMLAANFDSKVPKTMDDLTKLPGVARKTANIVLSNAYGIIEGIAVDTHVRRLSNRLGFTKSQNPEKIERDLMAIVPKKVWFNFTNLLISHGRKICKAKKPLCHECILSKLCPSAFKFSK